VRKITRVVVEYEDRSEDVFDGSGSIIVHDTKVTKESPPGVVPRTVDLPVKWVQIQLKVPS
jgi:hypothetical protein